MQTGRWMSLRHRSKNKMEANEVHIAHLWNLWTSGGFSWTGTVNHPPDLSRSSIHQWPMAVHGLYKLKIRLFSGKPLVATETRELSQLQTSLRNCHCLRAQPTECMLVEPVSWFVPHSSLAFVASACAGHRNLYTQQQPIVFWPSCTWKRRLSIPSITKDGPLSWYHLYPKCLANCGKMFGSPCRLWDYGGGL